jgi:hypothetical protein
MRHSAKQRPSEWSALIDHEMTAERQHMYAALSHLDDLQQRGDDDAEPALLEINRSSVASVPGAQYAGLTIVDAVGTITSMAGTHQYVGTLDDVQRETQEGPCLSAAWNQHTIRVDDLETDDRWPRYRDAAVAMTPIRSVMSFRLFGTGTSMGALNFCAQSPGVFDDDSLEMGLIVAAHTSIAWNVLRREKQFRSALGSRDVIGQAKGMLMERFGIDALAAFELLRTLSQDSNTKIIDIAEKIVDLGVRSG